MGSSLGSLMKQPPDSVKRPLLPGQVNVFSIFGRKEGRKEGGKEEGREKGRRGKRKQRKMKVRRKKGTSSCLLRICCYLTSFYIKKKKRFGAPGWLSGLSVQVLISAQVMILGL